WYVVLLDDCSRLSRSFLASIRHSRDFAYSFFFFQCSADHRDLHSFPTRRSSDLNALHNVITHGNRSPATLARIAVIGMGYTGLGDRKSTRLNSSHEWISYAVFCLKKKKVPQLVEARIEILRAEVGEKRGEPFVRRVRPPGRRRETLDEVVQCGIARPQAIDECQVR